MKIIHTSDLHLSSPIEAHLSPQRARQRREEITDSMRGLFDAAKSLGAEAMIIAGDLFDSESPSCRERDAFLDTVWLHEDLNVYYLCGNHERDALEYSTAALPKNLHIFGNDWTYFNIGDVTIAGRRDTGERIFDTLRLDQGRKNISVLHGAINSDEERIPLARARHIGLDYIALGHYHSYSATAVDERAVAVYSGTPEGRGFDECGSKGFVLLDTNGGRVKYSFIPHAKRELKTIDASISGIQSRDMLLRSISDALSVTKSDDIVRLRLIGERDNAELPCADEIERFYANKYFHFEVDDHTRDAFSIDEYMLDASVIGEFLRLLNKRDDISDEDKMEIARLGIAVLRSEEVPQI